MSEASEPGIGPFLAPEVASAPCQVLFPGAAR
jgi:hypothetical protein